MTAEGWLLVSLFHGGPVKRTDPAAWKHVLATADWINHAVMSFEEVSAGVRALARRGLLVERVGGVLVLSLRARNELSAAYGTRKRLSVFKLWEAGDTLIATQKVRPSSVRGPTRTVYRMAAEACGVTPGS